MELSLSRVCCGHSSSTSPVSPTSGEPSLPPRSCSLLSVYSGFTLTTPCKHTRNEIHLPLQARGDPALHINWAPAVPHLWSSSVSAGTWHTCLQSSSEHQGERRCHYQVPQTSQTQSALDTWPGTPGAAARLDSLTTHTWNHPEQGHCTAPP